jgi:hypothetical protein
MDLGSRLFADGYFSFFGATVVRMVSALSQDSALAYPQILEVIQEVALPKAEKRKSLSPSGSR